DFEAINQISKLAQKYIFVILMLTFLMLFIIPQFKQMFDEFGVELPFAMSSLIHLSNFLIMYWFLFALAAIAIMGLVTFFNPWVLINYFMRWIPSRWQQPVLSKRAQQELSVAWVVQTSDDLPDAARQFITNNGIGDEELDQITAAAKTDSSSGVFEALASRNFFSKSVSWVASNAASRESAAWMLRKMSRQNQTNRRRYGMASLRTIIWIGDLFLMMIAGWAGIAIFQSLLLIIRGLT
ncbi:hypothetical protein N9Y42_01095, partial [Mariniblastus sp.]|nr:hypothetical protein [Mariniblastus sp.]